MESLNLAETKIFDLTKIMDDTLEIYASDTYRDPPFEVKTWSSIEEEQFWVSQLSLGTQTGTHIDAPAHFAQDGAMLDALPAKSLIGRYFWLNLDDDIEQHTTPDELLASYQQESILFLIAYSEQTHMTEKLLDTLCALPAKVWVLAGAIRIVGQHSLYFHQCLAKHGIYLVEDLDMNIARHIKPGGELIALPLRLSGVSGAPCRVLVLYH